MRDCREAGKKVRLSIVKIELRRAEGLPCLIVLADREGHVRMGWSVKKMRREELEVRLGLDAVYTRLNVGGGDYPIRSPHRKIL